jgi:hypothetical protein
MARKQENQARMRWNTFCPDIRQDEEEEEAERNEIELKKHN